VVRGERYSEKCDLYSFAVVLVAMLELKPDVLDVFAEYLNPIEKVSLHTPSLVPSLALRSVVASFS
jgi:hypothetical protein